MFARAGLASVIAATALAAGCYAPDLTDGEFACTPDDPRCPSGYSCDECSHRCLRPEHLCNGIVDGGAPDRDPLDFAFPDLSPRDLLLVDLAGVDRAIPDQAVVDLSPSDPAVDGAMADRTAIPDQTLPPDQSIVPDQSILPDATVPVDLAMSDLRDGSIPPDMAQCVDNGMACNGKSCGSAPNNCGVQIGCGSCANNKQCVANQCVDCISNADCGPYSPVCSGGSCHACTVAQDCIDGGWGSSCNVGGGGICACGGNNDCVNARARRCSISNVCVCGTLIGACTLGTTCSDTTFQGVCN